MGVKRGRDGFSRVEESVSTEEARRRILRLMIVSHWETLWRPAALAWAVWPGHKMKPQGAAFAVGRILHEMQTDGLIFHSTQRANWGYRLTTLGRKMAGGGDG